MSRNHETSSLTVGEGSCGQFTAAIFVLGAQAWSPGLGLPIHRAQLTLSARLHRRRRRLLPQSDGL